RVPRARNPVRVVELLGRDRRTLVRLHQLLDQPRRRAARAARHRTRLHGQPPDRRRRGRATLSASIAAAPRSPAFHDSRKYRPRRSPMSERIDKFGLQVARSLYDMIEREALPGTGVSSDQFWKGLSELVHEKGP